MCGCLLTSAFQGQTLKIGEAFGHRVVIIIGPLAGGIVCNTLQNIVWQGSSNRCLVSRWKLEKPSCSSNVCPQNIPQPPPPPPKREDPKCGTLFNISGKSLNSTLVVGGPRILWTSEFVYICVFFLTEAGGYNSSGISLTMCNPRGPTNNPWVEHVRHWARSDREGHCLDQDMVGGGVQPHAGLKQCSQIEKPVMKRGRNRNWNCSDSNRCDFKSLAGWTQGKQKHININRFAGLSRDWVGGKI